ncbi:helix-turn-helix domain-containing protein [Aneurinibacillus danicus]|jgi:transcriptional regulator with XRE-family HTH domain|uniref:Transcriptional regulator n=1 Tax=Aneurinibacillus danicus TaxID=267746 RepID=A0A511VA63_9BACL|nr:helix-turn-helix transcriptional regulator [Aneurinibacillus danicus]GEN35806.1 transcriptional regulator [Aneurinibacillus danicus]
MEEFRFSDNVTFMRKKFGMTQGDVATYIGISAAAVSKWEQGLSYPDLTLLPKLASLFDTTIDELLGYEPQLTADRIMKIYQNFSKRFSKESFEIVQKDVENIIKEYYSCCPLLVRISQLYLNHYVYSQNPQMVLNRIVELCERVDILSDDHKLIQEAQIIHASALLIMDRPQELLKCVGYEVPIQFGVEKLIARAYAMLKDNDKVTETLQTSTFQHLFIMISSEIEFLKYTPDNQNLFDQMVNRIEKVIDIYNIEKLNIHLKLSFYYQASLGYMKQHRHTDALCMLERFYHTCKNISFPMKICGDDYFYTVDNWIEQNINAGPYAPRNEQAIKDDLLNMLQKEPIFVPLHEDSKFKLIVKNLQRIFQSKREN